MITSFILATDKNGLIGKGDKLPWHYPEDFAWFKHHTRFKSLVMGSRTFNGIGRGLPDRLNLALTRDPENFYIDGVTPISETYQAFQLTQDSAIHEMVIGGGNSLFSQYLHQVDKIYMTVFEKEHEGDVYLKEPLLLELKDHDDLNTLCYGWKLESRKVVEGTGTFKIFIKVTEGLDREIPIKEKL